MRHYGLRLAADGVFCFVAELIYAAYTKALVGGLFGLSVLLCSFLPFVGFLGYCWFVEEKCRKRKFGYVVAGAVGYAAGRAVVMWLWP